MVVMPNFEVRLAQRRDCAQVAQFCALLWPTSTAEEHARELTLTLEGTPPVTLPLVIFVAVAEDGSLAGFVEVDLRSHADGCDPIRPVGYVEGWYVAGEVSSLRGWKTADCCGRGVVAQPRLHRDRLRHVDRQRGFAAGA